MNFYLVKEAVGASIGHMYPQCQRGIHHVPIDDVNHLWRYGRGQFLPESVSVPDQELHTKAILTDLISTVTIPGRLVVSQNLMKLIAADTGTGFQFFPVKVIEKRETAYPYWIVNPVQFKMGNIDFKNCEIWIQGIGNALLRKIPIPTESAFEILRQNTALPESPSIEKLVISPGVIDNVFALSHLAGNGIVMSEKMKDKIENAGFTGVEFIPL